MLLSQIDIANSLSRLTGWAYQNNAIVKDYSFRDFAEALKFVNLVGAQAEGMNHHPDILLHGWNKVTISISTHTSGGVTGKDFTLAEEIEGLLK